MILPKPPEKYSQTNEAETRTQIDQRFQKTQQKNGDYEPTRFILKSPDGTRWQVTVDNAGALSTTAL